MSDIEEPLPSTLYDFFPATDGYVSVPEYVMAQGRERVKGILPGEWRFVAGGTVMIDSSSSHRAMLDTNDTIPDEPTSLKLLEARPIVMRVLRGMGSSAIDGYIVDYRRVTAHKTDDRGLGEGVGSSQYMAAQREYGTVIPIMVIFQVLDRVQYHGDERVISDAKCLQAEVDAFVAKLSEPEVEPRRAHMET